MFQFSLRTLLIAAIVANLGFAWQAYRSQQEAVAITAIEKMGGDVTTEARSPQFIWRFFDQRIGRMVVEAHMPMEHAEVALPHLQALPHLKAIDLSAPAERDWISTDRSAALETLVAQSLPNVRVRSFSPLCTLAMPRIVIGEHLEERVGFVVEE